MALTRINRITIAVLALFVLLSFSFFQDLYAGLLSSQGVAVGQLERFVVPGAVSIVIAFALWFYYKWFFRKRIHRQAPYSQALKMEAPLPPEAPLPEEEPLETEEINEEDLDDTSELDNELDEESDDEFDENLEKQD